MDPVVEELFDFVDDLLLGFVLAVGRVLDDFEPVFYELSENFERKETVQTHASKIREQEPIRPAKKAKLQ